MRDLRAAAGPPNGNGGPPPRWRKNSRWRAGEKPQGPPTGAALPGPSYRGRPPRPRGGLPRPRDGLSRLRSLPASWSFFWGPSAASRWIATSNPSIKSERSKRSSFLSNSFCLSSSRRSNVLAASSFSPPERCSQTSLPLPLRRSTSVSPGSVALSSFSSSLRDSGTSATRPRSSPALAGPAPCPA